MRAALGPAGARPAPAASASVQRPTTLTSYGRARPRGGSVRSAASSSRYSPPSSGIGARLGIEQPGELREVDGRRVRQAADDLARQVALDLLGLELAHELLQQLARLASPAQRTPIDVSTKRSRSAITTCSRTWLATKCSSSSRIAPISGP